MSALRIGCVPYLNARPLIRGLAAELATPAALSVRFAAGHYDAALLPVYEILRLRRPRVVDGFGICSFGPVRSVIVAHRAPLGRVPEIVLDPASRTSENLLRMLLRTRLGLSPRLVQSSCDPLAARLLIGDPALDFQRDMDPAWQILDLGQAWTEWTGLPFVFAAWVLGESAPPETPEALRAAAVAGLAARAEIASREPDPAAALDYLTHAIRHPLGGPEKTAIEKFRTLLTAAELLPSDSKTQKSTRVEWL
jgi:predicted solute-binding protein